jgi:uncharacterized protein DUF4446
MRERFAMGSRCLLGLVAGPAEDSIGLRGRFSAESSPARLGRPETTAFDPCRSTRHIDLNALVSPNIGTIVAGLAVIVLALVLIVLIQARRLRRLGRRLDGLTRGSGERSLEAILDAHLDKVYAVAAELDDLAGRSSVLETNGRRAIQRVGLVRFNPFEDTGGNQSFSLALTDAGGDGFVVSSLHARTGTRVYAKSLVAGRADSALSAEEAEALRQALAEPIGQPGGSAPGRRDRAGAAV